VFGVPRCSAAAADVLVFRATATTATPHCNKYNNIILFSSPRCSPISRVHREDDVSDETRSSHITRGPNATGGIDSWLSLYSIHNTYNMRLICITELLYNTQYTSVEIILSKARMFLGFVQDQNVMPWFHYDQNWLLDFS